MRCSSLQAKLILPLLAVVGIITTAGVLAVNHFHAAGLREDILSRADLTARSLRDIVEITSDPKSHLRLVQSMGAMPDMELAVLLVGKPRRVVASTRNDWNGLPLERLPDPDVRHDLLKPIVSGSPLSEFHPDLHVVDVAYPLRMNSQKTGAVRLEEGAILVRMRTTRLEAESAAGIQQGVALVIIGLGILWVNAVLLIRQRVLIPLGKFYSTTRRYQDGDTTARVQLNSDDQLGAFSRAYDDFLDRLEAEKERACIATERLAESEKRLDLALQGGGLGIWDWDIATGTVHFDARWCALLGYSPGEIEPNQHTWEKLVHPEDAPHLMRVLNDHLAGKTPHYDHEHRLRTRSGEWRWVRECGQAFSRDGQQHALRMVGTLRDISTRKAAEQAMQAARDAALETVCLRSNFIASMSHEFRTPMNGVLGMLSLLGDTQLDAEQREFVEVAQRSSTSFLDLVNDLLDFSKIEAGALTLECIDFDARTLIEESVEVVAQRAHAKGLKLAALIAPDTPEWMTGDPTRLRQILLNLLSNAVKFTEKGEVTLRVRIVNTDAHNVVPRFEVEDTGIGMSAESQRRLFQPFVQGDGSITRKFGGTGLGLVICKQLVECMGGEIGVESELGRGSRIWFTARLGLAARSPALTPLTDLRDSRVLVMERHAATREALCQQLNLWGMRADGSADGTVALEKLRVARAEGQPYALAFLERHPFEANGMALARQIRRLAEHNETRLVLLTALGQRGDSQEAREAGVQGSLVKPVRRQALRDCLVTVMGLASVQKNTPSTPPTSSGKLAKINYHVLVVDDTEINQKVAVRTLSHQGISADVASNGLEALAALEQRHYDLILMDCHMPEMDGYQATAHIRELPAERQGQIPIIALTADALQENIEKCLGAGMNDYLGKPFKPQELRDKLAHWLDQREPRARPEASLSDGLPEPRATRWPVGAPPPARDALDRKTLASLRELFDDNELAELIAAYLREMVKNLRAMHEAVATDDREHLHGLFHSMKGGSGNLGAKTLQNLCQELEDRVRDGQACSPQEAQGVEAEFARVKPALEQLAVASAPSESKAA